VNVEDLEPELRRAVDPFLGETDNAFQWLRRAYRQNDPTLGWMKVDPMLDSIRSDPRYVELLRKADLND